MKLCPYCNNALEDTALFCGNCGAQWGYQPQEQPQQQPQYYYPQQSYEYQPQQQPYDEQQSYAGQQAYGYQPAQQPYAYQYQNPQPLQQTQPKKKKVGLIAGIAAAVLALVIIIGAVGGGSNNSTPSSNQHVGGNNSHTPNQSQNNTQNNTQTNTQTNSSASKSKTVMIYMVGSDLESEYGSASLDIFEMAESGVDVNANNILIYTGGASTWAIDIIPSDKNCIYRLMTDDIELVKECPSANMGNSSTLSEFMSFCTSNYPADEYGLILWNHGAGPMLGYGLDENYNDMLDMSELKKAMTDAGFGSGQKLEFLGFDACLMGSIETAWGVKDYAKYLIASQETEPGIGWNYSFLKQLNYYDSGEDIGKVIVDTYFTGYEETVAQYPQFEADLTLSCMDLSKIGDVEESLNSLFEKVDENILSGYFPKVSRQRNQVKSFGKYATNFEYDLVDISHLVSLLSPDYSAEASQVTADLQSFVTYSRSNVENASGVSIYHPYDNTGYMSSWISAFESLGFASKYADYIANFGTMLANPSDASWKAFGATKGVAIKDGTNNELSIQLTQEQKENYASSAYYILKKINDDEYMFIFAGFDTQLDEDGTLSASYDNKAVFAVSDKTGAAADTPVTMYQVRDGSGDQKYSVSAIFWLFADDIADWRTDPVEWQIKIEDGKPKALGAYLIPDEEKAGIPQKQMLDYTTYSSIEFSFSTRIPKKDESGNLLPYFQWDSTGCFYGSEYDVAEGLHFECREIDNKEDYFVMFVINDVQGNTYASDMFTLPG